MNNSLFIFCSTEIPKAGTPCALTSGMKRSPVTIILAEDEDDLRTSVQLAFRLAGCVVKAFSNGADALAFLQQANPNEDYVLVTDILMPKLSGLDLIREAKLLFPHMPAVAVTGYGDKPMVTQLLRYGCDDFLDKPYAAEVLIEVVAKAIQQQRQRQQAMYVRLKAIESMEREWSAALQRRSAETESGARVVSMPDAAEVPGNGFGLVKNGQETTLIPPGSLTGERSRCLREQLERWLTDGGRVLRLDLSQVQELDALALSVLCALSQEIRAVKGSLSLIHVTPAVRSLLHYLKLDQEFYVGTETTAFDEGTPV